MGETQREREVRDSRGRERHTERPADRQTNRGLKDSR